MAVCPFCKEKIMDGAIKCKHCGEMFGDATNTSGNQRNSTNYQLNAPNYDYSLQVVITIVLYLFGIFPGFLANWIFYFNALDKERKYGRSFPGVWALRLMWRIFWIIIIILGVIAFKSCFVPICNT